MGGRRILRWQYVGETFCNLIFCSRKRRKEGEGTMEDAVTSVYPPPPKSKEPYRCKEVALELKIVDTYTCLNTWISFIFVAKGCLLFV